MPFLWYGLRGAPSCRLDLAGGCSDRAFEFDVESLLIGSLAVLFALNVSLILGIELLDAEEAMEEVEEFGVEETSAEVIVVGELACNKRLSTVVFETAVEGTMKLVFVLCFTNTVHGEASDSLSSKAVYSCTIARCSQDSRTLDSIKPSRILCTFAEASTATRTASGRRSMWKRPLELQDTISPLR